MDGDNNYGPRPVPSGDLPQRPPMDPSQEEPIDAPRPSAVFSPQPRDAAAQIERPDYSQPQPYRPASTLPDNSYVTANAPVQRVTQESAGQQYPAPGFQQSMPAERQYPAGSYPQPAFTGQQTYGQPPAKSNKKKLFAGSLAALVVLLGTAGFVFGYHLPNKPENVWAKGLDRSGQAVDAIVKEASDKETLAGYKNSELTGTLELNMDESRYTGFIQSKYGEKASSNTLTVTMKDQTGTDQKIGLDMLTEQVAGNEYPDLFFKYTGLAAFGLDAYYPGLGAYDGKWIYAPSDYIQTLIPTDTTEEPAVVKKEKFTHEDATELASAVTDTTRQHVLTADPNASVLVRKAYVGTEKLDNGTTAYHYKVALSKGNLKNYCKALIEDVMDTEAYKKLPYTDVADIEKDKKDAVDSCNKSIDDTVNESDTFDLWIDKKYKLIHKVRIADKENDKSYYEIGQDYRNGDEYPVFFIMHDDEYKVDGRIDVSVNRKTDNTKASIDFTGKGDQTFTFKASMTFKPHEGEVKIEKPRTVVPLSEVMKLIGTDTAGGQAAPVPGSIQAKAMDTERQTDIKALQAQLEAYYAQEGFYPILTDVNNATWRKTHMKGLSEEAMKAPIGTVYALAVNPSLEQYGYNATDCHPTKRQCQRYVLSAQLSDGRQYKQESVN